MGSFKGHALPGTLFLVVGVWHIWTAIVRYVTSPHTFRVRAWSPVPGFGGRLRHLELYLVTVGAFIDMCIELLYSTHLKFFVKGVLNPAHMNDFEHSGMLLMFFLFGLIALLSENFPRSFSLPEGALLLIAATAFSAEYLLFFFHSTTHKGLEGYYHLLLVLLIGLCILNTVAGALAPTSLAADLCRGISITLQGIWFYQTAFTLYGPTMPQGCRLAGNEIKCRSKESQLRGELFANFQLFSAVFVVLAGVIVSYVLVASRHGHSQLKSLQVAELEE